MSEKLLEAIQACARQRVRIRQVPRGHRVSFPFPVEGDHLLELSFEALGHNHYRMTDGGAFFAFLADHGIAGNSEAAKDSLESLRQLGFRVSGLAGEQEIGAEHDVGEIGCASWDLATAVASSIRALMRDQREGVAHFEAEIRRQLEPFKKAISWKHEVHPGIFVPIYVRARRIAAVMIGSHGRTVSPGEVARRQAFPFYQMYAKNIQAKFTRYALVSPSYWKSGEVRRLVKDVDPEVVQTNQMERFERVIRGDHESGLAIAR